MYDTISILQQTNIIEQKVEKSLEYQTTLVASVRTELMQHLFADQLLPPGESNKCSLCDTIRSLTCKYLSYAQKLTEVYRTEPNRKSTKEN